MDEKELSQFNKDTRDSIKGKNNYDPTVGARGGYWPQPEPNYVPSKDWNDKAYYD